MHLLGTTRYSLSPPTANRPVRRGFTVVEVVVVIAIVGVLTSLILPAVMRARESSRRIQCLSNIRQVGVALNSFESTNHFYPLAVDRYPRDYSALARLLPYLEEDTVYNSINFTPVKFEFLDAKAEAEREAQQAFFGRVRVDVFVCPSDRYSAAGDFGGTNYRVNMGTHSTLGCRGLTDPIGGDGFFYMHKELPMRGARAADIRDGLSQTVAFAERTVGSAAAGIYPEGNYFNPVPHGVGNPCWPRDDWIRRCRSLTFSDPEMNAAMGHSWLYAGWDNSYYNHVLVPNSPVPDCGTHMGGIVAARSWHRGGVNVSMGDGQARFIDEEIDLKVWRALGTRAGGEVIGAPDF